MNDELREASKLTMLQGCGLRVRRQNLRYAALMALLVSVCWVAYWLAYMSRHEESALEKKYNAQERERQMRRPEYRKSNPFLPQLHSVQKDHQRGLGHIIHQSDLWKKPKKTDHQSNIRVHPKTLEKDKKFPNIVDKDFSLSNQLGIPDEDLDTLKRKVIGSDVLNKVESDHQRLNNLYLKQQDFGGREDILRDKQSVRSGQNTYTAIPMEGQNNEEMSQVMLQRFKQLRQGKLPSVPLADPNPPNNAGQNGENFKNYLNNNGIVQGDKLPRQSDSLHTTKNYTRQKEALRNMTQKDSRQPQKPFQKLPYVHRQVHQNAKNYSKKVDDKPFHHDSLFRKTDPNAPSHKNVDGHPENAMGYPKADSGKPTEDQVQRIQHQIDVLSKQIIESPSHPDVQVRLQKLAALQQQLKQKQSFTQSIPEQEVHPPHRNVSTLGGPGNQYHQEAERKQEQLRNNLYSPSLNTQSTRPVKKPPQAGQALPNKKSEVKKGGTKDQTSYTLVHSGKASMASSYAQEHFKTLPDHVSKESYIFESSSLPKEMRYRPSIGNGHLGTVIHNKHVFLHGFYNGYQNQSHRAEIPSTVAVKFVSTEPPSNCTRRHVLNTGEGVYSEVCTHEFYTVSERIFAHRTIPGLLVVEVDLTMEAYYPLVLSLSLNKWEASYDMTFRQQELNMTEVSLKAARISAPETQDMTYEEVFVLYDHVPNTLKAPADSLRTKWTFLTAIGASREEVFDTYNKGSSLIHSGDQLYRSHVHGWAALWQAGYIDIKGNPDMARATFGSMYYLLSSVPLKASDHWPFVGLSPTGLAMGSFDNPQDFHGRVFVDQELWMFPPILTFHPDLAKVVLSSRSRLQAKRGAASLALKSGVDSALKYPWQVGISGQELSRKSDAHQKALYVSGLISHCVLQYLQASNDTSVLLDQRYDDVLVGIANFYVKKLHRIGDGSLYGLRDVQTPDNYARNVDNSAFTNAVAAIAMLAPEMASRYLGQTFKLNYHLYSDNMYIPVDRTNRYHKEHDAYRKGTSIHHADTVLLGYPLMWQMSSEVRKNDLEQYEKVLDPRAPPTNWAMHAIGWLEVDEIERANQAFGRQFAYIRSDFQIWTEKVTSQGACNYISAAGAYLQSLVNGYLGLRYHDNHLDIKPQLPAGVTEMHFVGIKFLGSSLDIWVWTDQMAIQVLPSPTPKHPMLSIYSVNPPKSSALLPGRPVTLRRKKARIFTGHTDLPDTL